MAAELDGQEVEGENQKEPIEHNGGRGRVEAGYQTDVWVGASNFGHEHSTAAHTVSVW